MSDQGLWGIKYDLRVLLLVYSHRTNLRLEGPPPACANSDRDPKKSILPPSLILNPSSFLFSVMRSSRVLVCGRTYIGMAVSSSIRDGEGGQWTPRVPSYLRRIVPGQLDASPSHMESPLTFPLPQHPGAMLWILCMRACPMNLKYDRTRDRKATASHGLSSSFDFPSNSHKRKHSLRSRTIFTKISSKRDAAR